MAHDGRNFESLYDFLDPDNVLESAALDKGYDADRIRERLAVDDPEPVIPPINTRGKKRHYDKALQHERHRVERFFQKLKPFRRMATRYDSLRLATTRYDSLRQACENLLRRTPSHRQ